MYQNEETIIGEIRKGIQNMHSYSNAVGRQEWTDAFKRKLINIGRNAGYKVYASTEYEEADSGEWLFDLCWSMEPDLKDEWMYKYSGLKLACEMEWNMDKAEILHDFQKLGVAKADYKLMIVQYNESSQFDEIKKWCEESLSPSLYNDGSKYFLIGSGNKESKIRMEELWVKKANES